MLELYLRELKRELARSLPPEDVAARLAEAEAHLTEGVAGRVELGMESEDAQREAIRAFGATRRVAAANRPAREGKANVRLAFLGVGYALMVLFALFGWRVLDALPEVNVWLFDSWFVLALGFAVAGFVARRPQPFAVGGTVLGVAALTWFILGSTCLNLYSFGGTGIVPPGMAARTMAEDRRLLAERTEDRAIFDAGWTTIRGLQGIVGLHCTAGYRAPVIQPVTYTARLAYETVPDAKTALRAWSDVRQRGSGLFETETLAANLQAIEKAQAAPVRNLLSILPDLFLPNVGIAALAILVDAAFSGLGSFAFCFRRRRRFGVA